MWEPNLGAGPQGQLLLNNDIKASAFQPCVTLSTQETGKAIYLGGRKGRRENVFRALLAAGVWLLRGQTTKPAPRASIPKSGPCVTYTNNLEYKDSYCMPCALNDHVTKETEQLILLNPELDAIICVNDNVALGVFGRSYFYM